MLNIKFVSNFSNFSKKYFAIYIIKYDTLLLLFGEEM